MKKLLVTGAGGFLGWNICKIAQNSFSVTGITHRTKCTVGNIKTETCDLTNTAAITRLFDSLKPDIVIHTAAASDPNFCQQHPDISEQINVSVPEKFAELCAQHGCSYIFTSTDLVFDGTSAPYNELSPENPLSLYGQQKLRAEKAILLKNATATICRMPLMFGDTPQGSEKFLQLMLKQLLSGKSVSLFTDEFRTPVSAADAANGLLLFSHNFHGIINLGGHERLSRYDFGKMIAELAGIAPELIKPCLQSDVKMSAPRPKDVSLDSNKAFKIGYAPGNVFDELKKLECINIRKN